MDVLEITFWSCAAVVLYTYLAYPLLLALLSRCCPRPRRVEPIELSVSIVLPVHNEEKNLSRRLDELTRLLRSSGLPGEIIVVSDASTDGSAQVTRSFDQLGVRLVELPTKQGKAVGLSAGCAEARGELLVFADARQRWADDALVRLVANFADPQVGAVSGDLVLETAPGVLAGVGLYWRFEKWLRLSESKLYAQVGVTGAISACRRALFRPVPPGTILDDVYWPLQVVLQGYRVVHDESARAYDRLPDRPRDEFRRKVRTLAGNFQLVTRLPLRALFPWGNRVWWQFVSHKLLRLVVPWALLALLIVSALLRAPLYQATLAAQLAGYSLAALGLIPAVARRVKVLGAAGSSLVLNGAAWLAFWVWLTGRAARSWHKVQYEAPASEIGRGTGNGEARVLS
jgi:cellulose synthase/poly-beta-1,6-N-acetylglucosamine synthase-like glycosyltransferase